jgi:capsular polysaccharide biosynthesis protein
MANELAQQEPPGPLEPYLREAAFPRRGIVDSARQHWLAVLAPVVVAVATAIVVGLVRNPEYRATARLNVGGINLNTPGALSGLALATQSLASTYSRAIQAQPIVQDVARDLSLSPGAVRSALSASPIPESSVIKVGATASSRRAAVALANAASSALVRYVRDLNANRPDSPVLLAKYQQAALTVLLDGERLRRLRALLQRQPSAEHAVAVQRADAVLQQDVLRREGFSKAYFDSVESTSTASLVQMMSRATTASSDRSSKLQLYAVIAAAIGLVAGLVLAMLLSAREAPAWRLR